MKTTIVWEKEKVKKLVKKLKSLGIPIHFGPLFGKSFTEEDWHVEFVQFFERLMELTEFFSEEEYYRKQKDNSLAKQITTVRDNDLKKGNQVSYEKVGGVVNNTRWYRK